MARVSISLDADLLEAIDDAARDSGRSRTAWLVWVARSRPYEPHAVRVESGIAAAAEMRRIYRAAPRRDVPFVPAAEEIRRMREERLDKLDALTSRRAPKRR
jgi:hypothetical protein